MPHRELAGPGDDGETQHKHEIETTNGAQMYVELVRSQPWQQHRREHGDRNPAKAKRIDLRPCHASRSFRPSSPCGRSSTTAITTRNWRISASAALTNVPAKLSIRPMSRPPATAPGTLPRPPMTTTTKALRVGARPTKGATERTGAMSAP